MIQPYGCDTFEYCALPTCLCNMYVGPSTNSTASDKLYTPDLIMQKYALFPTFDTIGL